VTFSRAVQAMRGSFTNDKSPRIFVIIVVHVMQIDAIVFQRWLKMDWSCKVSKCHVHILWMDGKLVTLLLLLHVYHWQVNMHHYVQMH